MNEDQQHLNIPSHVLYLSVYISKWLELQFCFILHYFDGALSGLTQFFATKNPLTMIKNTFYFTLKALFPRKIFNFLS